MQLDVRWNKRSRERSALYHSGTSQERSHWHLEVCFFTFLLGLHRHRLTNTKRCVYLYVSSGTPWIFSLTLGAMLLGVSSLNSHAYSHWHYRRYVCLRFLWDFASMFSLTEEVCLSVGFLWNFDMARIWARLVCDTVQRNGNTLH